MLTGHQFHSVQHFGIRLHSNELILKEKKKIQIKELLHSHVMSVSLYFGLQIELQANKAIIVPK